MPRDLVSIDENMAGRIPADDVFAMLDRELRQERLVGINEDLGPDRLLRIRSGKVCWFRSGVDADHGDETWPSVQAGWKPCHELRVTDNTDAGHPPCQPRRDAPVADLSKPPFSSVDRSVQGSA